MDEDGADDDGEFGDCVLCDTDVDEGLLGPIIVVTMVVNWPD